MLEMEGSGMAPPTFGGGGLSSFCLLFPFSDFFFNDLRFSSSLSVASDTCNDDVVIGTDLKKNKQNKRTTSGAARRTVDH